MAGVDPLLGKRLLCPRMDRNGRAGDGKHRQDVLGGCVETDIAKHRGDGARRAPGGDQQKQCLGVIHSAVGVKNQPVGRHSCFRSAATREWLTPP